MASINRNYHGWSKIEDQKLIEALLNMVNTGRYRSDNSFKPGYLQHLEECLKESLPESGILAKPHIESRIRTMKKDWQVVYDMLNSTSGFSYDKEHNCVTTDAPEVWEYYVKNHKDAKKWKDKSLPHYEEMCVIFGKDGAQGNRAKSVVEMEQEVNMEEQEHQREDDLGEHSYNDTTNANFQVDETSSGRSKKRKRPSQANALFQSSNDAVVQFGDPLKETSAELSKDIKFKLDIKKKTLSIADELSKISLSQLDRFRAIDIIKDDHNRVMMFWTLSEDEREAWVRYMLSKFG